MLPVKVILCPTDFSEPSEEGFAAARELSRHFGCALLLVHVLPVVPALPDDPNYVIRVPEYERALHADAAAKLDALAETAVREGLEVRTEIGHGDAGAEVVRIAKEAGVDLIVLATHGLTGWRHLVFGSVAEKIVRRAHCSVLSVRGKVEPQP
jgi:nucleotide-binding universal stress UspA family protein